MLDCHCTIDLHKTEERKMSHKDEKETRQTIGTCPKCHNEKVLLPVDKEDFIVRGFTSYSYGKDVVRWICSRCARG